MTRSSPPKREGKPAECGACGKTYLTALRKPGADGVVRCPECRKKRAREQAKAAKASRGQTNYERYQKGCPSRAAKSREWRLKNYYNMSSKDYDRLLDRQGGVCAICKGTCTEKSRLVVDHDHTTGKVRGLLCNPCNRAIGQLQDDQKRLQSAIAYLRRNDPRNSWDRYFLQIAEAASSRSKDPSTQVGAVIVRDRRILGTGYNGFPSGVNDSIPERYDRPSKYLWTIHAEENAAASCARHGVSTEGATLYVTPLFPCDRCALMIANTGIKEVVTDDFKQDNPRWKERFEQSRQILEAARIIVRRPE